MKVVCLMSGGIDSPVAAYVMNRIGAEVIILHMDNRPYADERPVENVKKIVEQLRKVTGKEFPLYMAPHGITQGKMAKQIDSMYQCVMCKHAMQLTAREFCKKVGATAIVMGDSLGQVASQTLMNIKSESRNVNFTILRPLIGYDKEEIIKIAEEIGTFDISNLPSTDCTILPKRVVTEADLKKCLEFYEKTDIETLAKECADNAQLV
ncbi:MAG: 7-cyano-7-deazaguanine synthase [archaeon]|nr:7-cyano-7-deazaguanine synthase [archaeon]